MLIKKIVHAAAMLVPAVAFGESAVHLDHAHLRAERGAGQYVKRPAFGTNFDAVMPYLILIAVLLWRPTGLFGTQTVERI